MKTTAKSMRAREERVRNPNNTGVVKGKGPKLVIAIGAATIKKGKGSK